MKFSTFQEMTIPLAANQETKRALFGSFLRVISSTDDFEIGVSGEDWISGFTGLGLASELDPQTGERPTFHELRFRETKGAANSITMIVGEGQIFDDRVVFGGTNVPVEVENTPDVQVTNTVAVDDVSASVFLDLAPITVASGAIIEVMAQNAARKSGYVTNVGSGACWLNGSGLAEKRGVPLAPGQTINLETSAQVRAYNPNLFGVDIVVNELRRT